MTIRQVSIFIENQSGTLQKVLELIKRSRIQIIASTLADTADYGIYRIICNEPERACLELKEAGVAVTISHVFAVELDNRPGGAADVVARFIEGRGILIFRTDQTEEAEKVIASNGLHALSESELPMQY